MDAPERIWTLPDAQDCDWASGDWDVLQTLGSIEFVRADLHEALAAENARLREALDRVMAWHDKDKYTAGKMTLERSSAFAKARAALTATP